MPYLRWQITSVVINLSELDMLFLVYISLYHIGILLAENLDIHSLFNVLNMHLSNSHLASGIFLRYYLLSS